MPGSSVGRGTTQVNYHQQSSRPGSGSTGQTRAPGYTTSSQPVNYNTSAQPAYTTQQTGYTTAPPPPQPKQPPPQPPQPQQQAPPPQPPLPTPIQPKQEQLTPANTPSADSTANATPTTENGDGAPARVPFWKKRLGFPKVSNKVRKARMNAKLRRVLIPKNAITFLNELRPGDVKFTVREEPGWGYMASVTIDGKTYNGHGLSTSNAKVQASEQAIKGIMSEQLTKIQSTPPKTKEDVKEETEEEMDTDSKEEGGESRPKRPRREPEEDEMPWGSLAAFALNKLFAEWQSESMEESLEPPNKKYDDGDEEESYFTRRPVPPAYDYLRRFPPGPGPLPSPSMRGRGFGPFPPRGPPQSPFFMRPPHQSNFMKPRPPHSAMEGSGRMAPMKKIPEDANQKHPVMLLNQLRPSLAYNETREGQAPKDVHFKISIEVDGKEYAGIGRNKKEAKKKAAIAALVDLGITYPEEA